MMEEARESIQALLGQEEKHYKCSDYMHSTVERPICSPLHVVLQCANVVTDGFWDSTVDADTALLQSPTRISKFPSSENIQDLFASSEASPRSVAPYQADDALQGPSLSMWRSQMFDWACTVTDNFQIEREVIAIAFSILDRYVEIECRSECPVDREDFQLFAMVSMYMAIKTSLSYSNISVEVLIDMSRGFYTHEDIVLTERDILGALDWYVNPPTVIGFCRLYMQLFPTTLSNDAEVTCQEISELALCDSYFVSKSDSSVALATIMLMARRQGISLSETQPFMVNLQGLVNVDDLDFETTFRRLESLC
jgi:hypothetical protein